MKASQQILTQKRLASGAFIQVVSRLMGVGLGAAVTVCLARALTPSHLGTYTLAASLMMLAENFGDFGVTQTAMRHMVLSPRDQPKILGSLILVRSVVAFVMLVVSATIVFLLVKQLELRLMAVMILATMLLGPINAYAVVAQARLRSEVMGVVVLVQSIVWLTAVIVVWQLAVSPAWFGVGYFLAGLAQSTATLLLTRNLAHASLHHARAYINALFSDAWRLGLAGMFVTAYYKVDSLLLYRIAGARSAGYYGAAYKILDTLTTGLGALALILVPLVVNLMKSGVDRAEIATLTRAVLSGVFALTVAATAVLAPQASFIVHILYGSRYDASSGLLAVLLLTFIPLGFSLVLSAILIANNRLTAYVWIAIGVAIINIAANLVLIPDFGAPAAAWLSVGSELLVAVALMTTGRATLGLNLPMQRLFSCTVAGIAAALVSWNAKSLGFLPAIAAGFAVYIVFVVVLRGLTMEDLRNLTAGRKEIAA